MKYILVPILFCLLLQAHAQPNGHNQPAWNLDASRFIESICSSILKHSKTHGLPLIARHSTKGLPIFTKDEIWDHKPKEKTAENLAYNVGLERVIDLLEDEDLFGQWVILRDHRNNFLLAGIPEMIVTDKYDHSPIGIRWYSPLHSALAYDNDIPSGPFTESLYSHSAKYPDDVLMRSPRKRHDLIQEVLQIKIAMEQKNSLFLDGPYEINPVVVVCLIQRPDGKQIKVAGQVFFDTIDSLYRFKPFTNPQEDLVITPEEIIFVYDVFPDWGLMLRLVQQKINKMIRHSSNSSVTGSTDKRDKELFLLQHQLSIIKAQLSHMKSRHTDVLIK